MTVRLDVGRTVAFDLKDYAHLDHGYAATIHKAQGVTVDRAHVLATPGLDRHAAYVALSRHRDRVELHYGRDDFADDARLARVLSRDRSKDMATDYERNSEASGPFKTDPLRTAPEQQPTPERRNEPGVFASFRPTVCLAGTDMPRPWPASAWRRPTWTRPCAAMRAAFWISPGCGSWRSRSCPHQIAAREHAGAVLNTLGLKPPATWTASPSAIPPSCARPPRGARNAPCGPCRSKPKSAPIPTCAPMALSSAGRSSTASVLGSRATTIGKASGRRVRDPAWAQWRRPWNAVRKWNRTCEPAAATSASQWISARGIGRNLLAYLGLGRERGLGI